MSESEVKLQAARIFAKAAAYIRTYGWQVTGMGEYGKPRCSMGALESAHSAEKWNTALSKLMYDRLYEELDGLTLTGFNYKYRDGEKVAQLFERVSQKLALR